MAGYQQGYYPPQQQYGESQGYYQLQEQHPQQPPPQNYPPPQQYGGQYGGPLPPKQGETFEQQFAIEKPKFNDIWAAALFILTFLGFVAVSVLALLGYSKSSRTSGSGISDSNARFGLTTNTIILFALVLAVAFVVSQIYLLMCRKLTKQIIWLSAILNFLIGLGSAAYFFYRKQYVAAIIFLVFALFYAFCFWSWRSRIPFSVLMLQTVIDIAKNYGHVFIVSFIGGIVALAFSAWFSVTLVGIYTRWTPNSSNTQCRNGGCSDGKVYGLVAFVTFAAYWTSEVIKNVMHVTVSGVYGSWYFSAGGSSANSPPSHPTMGAFRRAMTYSFGSICLGSLIVSIIQLLRQAASLASSDAASSGDILQYVIFCIASCILAIVQWVVEFLNEYAYSYIALYGSAYFPAAKSTWRMIKDRGIDALIQDCLISPVLTMGAMFVGYLCALLAYLYLEFTKPEYNSRGTYTAIVMVFSFLIGLQIANTFLNPLKSGATTLFMAMAVDPQVLIQQHPDLYSRMIQVYPGVSEAIHV
ncbi:putative choline transporter, neither null mutation nor overexpression affects choline transport [Arthrobotrys musiformis]|uniref:Protein PNS1 n=1 Tax=Arthrobotrys musiformis TaxID=47236 RepID=A0AAV9VTI6_9PEZI